MENTNKTAVLTLEAAAVHFEALGEAGKAVLYKICRPDASPADIAALERWEAEEAAARNAANAEAAALLAKCASTAGVEAAALLDWIASAKAKAETEAAEPKKAKKA